MKPKTLQQAIVYFSNPDNCISFLVERRWPNGVECPNCGSKDVRFIPTRRIWECKTKHPKRQFSVKVGTIFEDSALPLDKWLVAMWMIANCENGVSSYEVARALGVTQKSAWFMLHRIRLAMQATRGGKIGGGGREVEADETFIGGAARFMHADVRKRRKVSGTGWVGKAAVMGLLERHGEVRTYVLTDMNHATLQGHVRSNVAPDAQLFTDAAASYTGLAAHYLHKVIDHAEAYAKGNVHTNGLENYWSLVKRGLKGTYISTEPFHLFRYLDEQSFRFNNRSTKNNPKNDADRFNLLLSRVVGKRLTYSEVTGKSIATWN